MFEFFGRLWNKFRNIDMDIFKAFSSMIYEKYYKPFENAETYGDKVEAMRRLQAARAEANKTYIIYKKEYCVASKQFLRLMREDLQKMRQQAKANVIVDKMNRMVKR